MEVPSEQAVVPARHDEQVVQEALDELGDPEIAPPDVAHAKRLLRAVESLGHGEGLGSLETLFGFFLATPDLHLQRAALFSIVRRAPASLERARQLLDSELPKASRLVRHTPQWTSEQRRLYERGLAAAVLGASGLAAARQPLLHALTKADDVSERALLVIALTHLERRDDPPELLRKALATTPEDAQVSMPLRWGLTQLVPGADLLPCSFEVVRLGAPHLVVEVLAKSGEDRADQRLAPRLLELAERVASSNAEAANNLMLSAATLGGPVLLRAIEERPWRRRSPGAAWIEDWVKDMAKAYSTCHEDLACHCRVLGEREVDVVRYKSARFVAARTAADQGLALLARMEDMPRPEWLAAALDQRLSHPTRDDVVRVEKLAGKGSALYAASSECSRLDSPLEELAIRLEVRRKARE